MKPIQRCSTMTILPAAPWPRACARRVAWFSRTQEVPQGAFVREDKITIRWDGAEKAVCRTDEVYIPGPHNLETRWLPAHDGLCLRRAHGRHPPCAAHL